MFLAHYAATSELPNLFALGVVVRPAQSHVSISAIITAFLEQVFCACLVSLNMVVRKPTPAGVFISESTSSRLSPTSEPASLTSSSYENVTRPSKSTSNSYSNSYHHSRSSPSLEGEEPAFRAVNPPCNGGPSAPKGGTDETLPVRLQAGGTTRSVQNMHAELPDILRAGLSGSGKATPRSSMDSERSREFWEEDVQDNTGRSQQFPRVDKPAISTSQPISASLTPSIPGPNLSKLPQRSNNPFRRGDSSSSFKKNSVSSSNASMFDIDNHKATTLGKKSL